LRRHPDLAWLKTPDDVTKLAGLQKRLLEAALDFLAPSGQLLYCTCSLQPEEGEEQIDAFLARHDHVHRLPFTATEIPGISDFVNDRGEVRTLPSHWPEHGGLDGFFIARMIAKG
jgi:16S rRNA (cytosine967-C5)-methyltransferase